MSIQFFATFKSFNPDTKELKLQVSFIDKEFIDFIELVNDGRTFKLFSKLNSIHSKTYAQLKKIWLMFEQIVKSTGEPFTRDNVETIEDYCKQKFYPPRSLNIDLISKITDDKELLEEKVSLSNQTMEEMAEVISKIEYTWPKVFIKEEDNANT